MAHEFTHQIINRQIPGLFNSSEWEESFGDIFGIMADHHFKTKHGLGNLDYIHGNGSGARNLSNPLLTSQPDHLSKRNDQATIHTNTGIQNKYFYLLAEGGSGSTPSNDITVYGIGKEKASDILWHVMVNHLTAFPTYMGLRDASITVAIELYGECSYERVEVQNAWAGVGVGEPFEANIEIHGQKTFCVDNDNWFRWYICSGLPGNFTWDFPQLWNVSIGPGGKTFEILDFNGLEGTPPWEHTITCTNIVTGESSSFTLKIIDCNNNYPPHPCEQELETEDRSQFLNSSGKKLELKLYPNPSSSVINFSIEGVRIDDISQVEVCSLDGSSLFKSKIAKNRIDIANLLNSTGLYFLKVNTHNGKVYSKLFIYNE